MIDAMTLSQVGELFAYWSAHPPLHLMIAAYLGIGRGRQGALGASDANALLAQLGPGFGKGEVHRDLPPVVLDFADLHRRSSRES